MLTAANPLAESKYRSRFDADNVGNTFSGIF